KPDGSFHDENKLLQMFRMKAQSFATIPTPDRGHIDEWLFLAQHVSLPTRLLDWTENALLALHFALKEERPIVWMMNPMALDTHVVSTLAGKEVEEYEEFPLTWVRPDDPIINIGHENIRGAWERNQRGLDLPVAVHPTYVHPRMGAQRSVFTVHGLKKDPIDMLIPASLLGRFEIHPRSTSSIKQELTTLGIQEGTAFPDLDGLARELTWLY
ncbi:MAG: FRG domain-containing protein, partial [Promethearchaeota archaeon]